MTLPTPEMTPFCTKLCSRPSGNRVWTHWPSAAKPSDSNSISGCAQLNTAWNITNRIASRISRPATGCSTTASIRLVTLSGFAGGVTASLMIRSACRCSARSSCVESGCHVLEATPPDEVAANASRCCSRSAVPPLRTETAVVTGMPSSAARRSRSIVMPRWRARSNMLSTSSIGRPTRLSSNTRRMLRRRLVASATQTMQSGAASSRTPSTTSRVISSSGLRPLSE